MIAVPLHRPTAVGLLRRAASLLGTLVIVALTVWLWPVWLGGSTRFVVVSGSSMEPTFQPGDAVVVHDGGAARVGDVVVFRVPDGAGRGRLVIHRVVGIRDDGTFVTRGDNRTTDDQFALTPDDIVGEPLLRIPRAGRLVMLARQPWVLAGVLGLLTTVMLWPRGRSETATEGQRARGGPFVAALSADGPVEPPEEREIDALVMADAHAWLDAQLSGMLDAAAARSTSG